MEFLLSQKNLQLIQKLNKFWTFFCSANWDDIRKSKIVSLNNLQKKIWFDQFRFHDERHLFSASVECRLRNIYCQSCHLSWGLNQSTHVPTGWPDWANFRSICDWLL
jgi:hypothetical protein